MQVGPTSKPRRSPLPAADSPTPPGPLAIGSAAAGEENVPTFRDSFLVGHHILPELNGVSSKWPRP